MDLDDQVRSKVGVAVCLRNMGNGTSRLFFDDIKSNGNVNPINLKYEKFYTFTSEFNNKDIENMEISGKQYEEIGFAIVARLLALNKCKK